MHEKTSIDDVNAEMNNIICIYKLNLKLNLQDEENLMLSVSNKFTKICVNEIIMTKKNITLLNFCFQLKYCKKTKKNTMKKQYNNIHVKNLFLLINKNSKKHSNMKKLLISKIYKRKTEKILLINTDKNIKKNQKN